MCWHNMRPTFIAAVATTDRRFRIKNVCRLSLLIWWLKVVATSLGWVMVGHIYGWIMGQHFFTNKLDESLLNGLLDSQAKRVTVDRENFRWIFNAFFSSFVDRINYEIFYSEIFVTVYNQTSYKLRWCCQQARRICIISLLDRYEKT